MQGPPAVCHACVVVCRATESCQAHHGAIVSGRVRPVGVHLHLLRVEALQGLVHGPRGVGGCEGAGVTVQVVWLQERTANLRNSRSSFEVAGCFQNSITCIANLQRMTLPSKRGLCRQAVHSRLQVFIAGVDVSGPHRLAPCADLLLASWTCCLDGGCTVQHSTTQTCV